jgi:type IV secretory pathway TrbD component
MAARRTIVIISAILAIIFILVLQTGKKGTSESPHP